MGFVLAPFAFLQLYLQVNLATLAAYLTYERYASRFEQDLHSVMFLAVNAFLILFEYLAFNGV